MIGYALIIIGFLICTIASINVNATFNRYKDVNNYRGFTASQVARQILNSNGLHHISVERVSGNLTDHYDPRANVVRLSDSVYDSTSVSAIGVAAHECGHAVQHSEGYVPMQIRMAIIPVPQFGSYAWYIVFILGLVMSFNPLIYAGIILFSAIVVFQFVTLPVEFNASSRALKTLEAYHILETDELKKSKKVLTAAAMTYVAALANSILQLFRLLLIASSKNRRE